MNNVKEATFVAVIALSLSTTACEVALLAASLGDDDNDTGYGDDGDGEAGFISAEGNTHIDAASFSGSIGQVIGISTDANATAYDDGEYASITLTASKDGWAAMVGFDLTGPERDALFEPGSVITLSSESIAFSYACSGDESDPYAYEVTQTDGLITVSEAPDDMLLVSFEVSYGGSDVVTGGFEIEGR